MTADKQKILYEIVKLIEKIDSMECSFYDSENLEEFKNIKESIVVSLDEMEELLEADSAYQDAVS